MGPKIDSNHNKTFTQNFYANNSSNLTVAYFLSKRNDNKIPNLNNNYIQSNSHKSLNSFDYRQYSNNNNSNIENNINNSIDINNNNNEKQRRTYYIIDKNKIPNLQNTNINNSTKIINDIANETITNNNNINYPENNLSNHNNYNDFDYSKLGTEQNYKVCNTTIPNNKKFGSFSQNDIMEEEINQNNNKNNKRQINLNTNISDNNNIPEVNNYICTDIKSNEEICKIPEYLKLKKENEKLLQENNSLKKKLLDTINQLNQTKSEININDNNYENNNDFNKKLSELKNKLNTYEKSMANSKAQYEDQINIYISQLSNCKEYLNIVYSFFSNIKEKYFPEFNIDSNSFNNNLTINNSSELSTKFKEIENYISLKNNELNEYKSKFTHVVNPDSTSINLVNEGNILQSLNCNNNNNSVKNNENYYKTLEQRINILEKEFKQKPLNDSNVVVFQNDIIAQKLRSKSNPKINNDDQRNITVFNKKKKVKSKKKAKNNMENHTKNNDSSKYQNNYKLMKKGRAKSTKKTRVVRLK